MSERAREVENPPAGQGAVVLDIGAGVGAAVVSAPAALAGAEIEICPAGRRGERPDEGRGWWIGDWRSAGHGHGHGHAHAHGHAHGYGHEPAWPHVSVLVRATPAGARCAAVFPGLRAGSYEVWLRPAESTALVVTVAGGRVTEATWPAGEEYGR